MFKSDKGEKMTPHLAFVTLLLYIMASDGEMDSEEIGQLLAVLGGEADGSGTIRVGAQNQKLLDAALKTIRSGRTIDSFLSEVTPLLTDAQRMCVLCNMLDSSLSDGQAEQEEQAIIGKVMQAFGISEDRFRPFFEVIVLKNDRSVFTNQNHPKNAPGYRVALAVR